MLFAMLVAGLDIDAHWLLCDGRDMWATEALLSPLHTCMHDAGGATAPVAL
jgi:hypothetical protein